MPSTRAGAPSIVVAQLAFIGDMVFTTPLFDEIKRAFGDATLTVVGRPAALAPLADHRAVDAVIAFDKDGSNHGVSGLVDVGRRVRAAHPDVFLGVSRSLRTALLARSPEPRSELASPVRAPALLRRDRRASRCRS
ncbi:MAG: glycosyltransferase family 9 protein, partial [Acidobacteria bacterium]|nr:glycosyltransferase family 9 protein [Acidobacteriota bacterium]